jgi:hypothetical protein
MHRRAALRRCRANGVMVCCIAVGDFRELLRPRDLRCRCVLPRAVNCTIVLRRASAPGTGAGTDDYWGGLQACSAAVSQRYAAAQAARLPRACCRRSPGILPPCGCNGSARPGLGGRKADSAQCDCHHAGRCRSSDRAHARVCLVVSSFQQGSCLSARLVALRPYRAGDLVDTGDGGDSARRRGMDRLT